MAKLPQTCLNVFMKQEKTFLSSTSVDSRYHNVATEL